MVATGRGPTFARRMAVVTEAERRDRERMAGALRAGNTASADARAVERAQQRVAAVKREGEALLLAGQGAEDALGEVVHKHRDEWLGRSRHAESAARARARALVGELRGALEGLAQARVLARARRCRAVPRDAALLRTYAIEQLGLSVEDVGWYCGHRGAGAQIVWDHYLHPDDDRRRERIAEKFKLIEHETGQRSLDGKRARRLHSI
jgi:hypothetical protein